ncbi:DnaD domain-containing protein [Priestia megaterium]|uniref:DnaD domain-containing protein n=1 Tax=Priestia megaterium TaxID=1404 RepID=UPI002E1D8405|nr:DnaD domain protein [Priestia megaterium]MED4184600.1 DnaD domain protein [Priestia megaterium]
MAKYRQVHTTFWQDPKVLEEMTPEDKYFYLYLLTNPNTTQIGVYQITKKQMAFDLGYSTESINSLLHRFITLHKLIKYNEQTRELAILNWGKYNLHKAGKPVIDCVNKELKEVKDKTLLLDIMKHIPNDSVLQAFSRHVDDTHNDTSTRSGQEKEEEKEKEKEEEKEEELLLPEKDMESEVGNPSESEVSSRSSYQSIFDFYQQNFGMLNPFISQQIQHWIDDMGEELVLEAMELTLKQQKAWKYAEGILKAWANRNVRTVADVRVLEAEFKNKRGFKQSGRVRKEMVPDWLSQDTGEVDSQTSTPVAVAKDEFEKEKRKLEAELKALHEELKAGKE